MPICAAVGAGVYPDFETAVARMVRVAKVFKPIPEHVEIYGRINAAVYQGLRDQIREFRLCGMHISNNGHSHLRLPKKRAVYVSSVHGLSHPFRQLFFFFHYLASVPISDFCFLSLLPTPIPLF